MGQVEVFIKQWPRILPRSSLPEKAPLAVRSSPPSLAPKDAAGASAPGGAASAPAASGGGVKVIAMATLPQQQGGPVPLMILPQGCLSYEREKVAPPPPPPPQQQPAAPPTSVVQKARGGPSKRPLELVAGGGVAASAGPAPSTPPVKRKRGRPRKPRPEHDLALPFPPVQPHASTPPSQTPIITSIAGGVIQKVSSSSSSLSSSQPVLVIQEQSGLVLGPAHGLVEHRGGVVVEAENQSCPLLLLQGPSHPSWELARTPMVEVIQKAPRPGNNAGAAPPPAAHLYPAPPPPPPPLPPPVLHEEQGEVEITLTPVELPVSPPPITAAAPTFSSVSAKEEDEEVRASASKRAEQQLSPLPHCK